MRRRLAAASSVAAAVLAAFGLSACNFERATGYVEIRTVPANPPAHLKLVLDSQTLDPLKKGNTVLRQAVGTHKLGVATTGDPMMLCELAVRKDRITTVTVSLLDRPPRCQCRSSTGTDAASNKRCEG